jgi:hypothetical protein
MVLTSTKLSTKYARKPAISANVRTFLICENSLLFIFLLAQLEVRTKALPVEPGTSTTVPVAE